MKIRIMFRIHRHNDDNVEEWELFKKACIENDVERAMSIYQAGNVSKNTLFNAVCANGNYELMIKIIDDVDSLIRKTYIRCLLMICCMCNQLKITKYLYSRYNKWFVNPRWVYVVPDAMGNYHFTHNYVYKRLCRFWDFPMAAWMIMNIHRCIDNNSYFIVQYRTYTFIRRFIRKWRRHRRNTVTLIS